MRTLQKDGFSFDYGGSHIIFSKNVEALNFILSRLQNNKVKNRRQTKILYHNCFVKYPFENGLSDLPKEENFECLRSFIKNILQKAGNKKNPSNLRDWFIRTFGFAISDKYLIPYNEKIWKYSLEEMGLDWVERIPCPSIDDILKSSLGLETEGYLHQLYFYYPKTGGIQAIIRSLEAVQAQKITTDYDIQKIECADYSWIVSDGKIKKRFDKIVSTIPLQTLIGAMDVPERVRNAVDSLKYNSLITVMLGVQRPKLNDLTWLYIPDRDVLTHRVSFPSNFSPYVAPINMSSLIAEVTCHYNDAIWQMRDEDIIDRVVKDLSRLQIINSSDICFTSVKRLEYAYVINDLNYKANLNLIRDYFKGLGISLVGRFAEYKYLNMDACVQSAMNFVKDL